MTKRGKSQTFIPNTLDCGEAAGWALWRLSQILAEIAQNQSGIAVKAATAANTQRGLDFSSSEGSKNE